MERVIIKVCKTYDIPKEAINDKLREQFKSKLWRMGKRLATHGGQGRECSSNSGRKEPSQLQLLMIFLCNNIRLNNIRHRTCMQINWPCLSWIIN